MKTYSGYTAVEIREMESNGTCPTHILQAYINNDYDGGDE